MGPLDMTDNIGGTHAFVIPVGMRKAPKGYNLRPMNSLSALRSRRGPLGGFIRIISSIWLGIGLLAAIIVYSSVGSAVPPVRQFFELTEFEYFNHWVFVTLIGMFCVALTAATVFRIAFNRINLGVITVHAGLLTLALGCVLYFGRKIEGDVLLFNPRVEILSVKRLQSGGDDPVVGRVVAAEGRSWEANMPALGGRYRVEVESVAQQGLATAGEVKLRAITPDAPNGRELVLRQDTPRDATVRLDDRIVLSLKPTNIADRFYDNNTPALLMRRGNESELFSLQGLPLYGERFVSGVEEVRDTDGAGVRSAGLKPIPVIDRWSMPLEIGPADGVSLADWPFRIEIDGYLPYATLQRTATTGGTELNPMARVEVASGGQSRGDWLFASVPRDSRFSIPGMATVEFAWLGDDGKIPEEWTRTVAGRHVLDVWVKDKGVRRQFDVQPGQSIEIEGTPYKLTIEDIQDDWPLVTAAVAGARSPVARVLVRSGGQSFHRSVLQRFPQFNQDRNDEGKKLSDRGLVDENIELRYTDASIPSAVIVAGDHLSPVAVVTAAGGKRSVTAMKIGDPLALGGDVKLTLAELIQRPRFEERPAVIPVEQRRPQPGRQASLIRLHVVSQKGDWQTHVWLPFESYNDMPTESAPHWTSVAVPNVGRVEFIYGRLPRLLPGRVALREMEVQFYPGGTRPSEWKSHIRWEDPVTHRVSEGVAYLNNTAKIGPWTLFQSGEAPDHESYTILGVGNRDGVLTMLLGCVLITLGMMYAFYVKPILKRRLANRLSLEAQARKSMASTAPVAGRSLTSAMVAGAIFFAASLIGAPPVRAADPIPTDPTGGLRAMQDQIHLDRLRTLIVQHNSRYQTIEAWARDVMSTVHGRDQMLGLDPVVGALELMFNRSAYDDQPVIYVKDLGVRRQITSYPIHVPKDEARRIRSTGLVSSQFLAEPEVGRTLDELSSKMTMRRAMDRLNSAMSYYGSVLGLLRVVPSPTGRYDSPWQTIDKLLANLGGVPEAAAANIAPVPGVKPETAAKVLTDFRALGKSWLKRDVAGINSAIDNLCNELPDLAPAGTYPSLSQRQVEVRYFRLGALTNAWGIYVAAMFASVFALIGGWKWAQRQAFGLFLIAFLAHGAGLAMRWYIVGRIPVANMFESVVSSAWVGCAIALVLAVATRRTVFVLAGSFLGFLSLVMGRMVGSEITQIAPILDDIMLRIHTVLIISSYAMITLAFAVSVCYLVVDARDPNPLVSRLTLGIVGSLGLCAALGTQNVFYELTSRSEWWMVIIPAAFAAAGAFLLAGLPRVFGNLSGSGVAMAPPGAAGIVSAATFRAITAPPEDRSALLEEFDRAQVILLHMSTISLFVGLVLGAIWADYSWGRPWGWDPKEVFALVTWLFYAILIHARLAVRRRALWTAVLSCVGFAAMQFNWWVVNFYIVGLHSYA